MLELHYPTVTKTILERQYPGKPTLKVAFGNDNGAIFENSSKLRASLFVTSRWPRSSGQTNYQVHHPPLDHNIDVYQFSCAPKLARKYETEHWSRSSKIINWSADSFQINHVTSISWHMSPRYGHGILVSDYPVLAAVNWPYCECPM